MPPQPGTFAVTHDSHAHKSRPATHAHGHANGMGMGPYGADDAVWVGPSAASSSRPRHGHGEEKKERKRKDTAAKLAKEMGERERRDDYGRQFQDQVNFLHGAALDLAGHPEISAAYTLRLYPLSLERSARLAALEDEARYARECVETAYDEERARVEEEWLKGRTRIRDRLTDGIEERRKRAREEKEGEGISGDTNLDAQARGLTRKLRNNKLGASPPPTPQPALGLPGATLSTTATAPPTNPHSLVVDELPSPFPLPLTASVAASGGGGNGRKRAKGGGAAVALHAGLGKAHGMLTVCKELEAEADLGEIRRGNKRRRTAGAGTGKA